MAYAGTSVGRNARSSCTAGPASVAPDWKCTQRPGGAHTVCVATPLAASPQLVTGNTTKSGPQR